MNEHDKSRINERFFAYAQEQLKKHFTEEQLTAINPNLVEQLVKQGASLREIKGRITSILAGNSR